MPSVIPVGMAEIEVAEAPNCLAVYGIGSCVIVSLYDKQTKIGGLAHIMLPDSSGIDKTVLNPKKFADTAVPALYELLMQKNVSRKTVLEAKIVGGSEMFLSTDDYVSTVGHDNTEAVHKALLQIRCSLVAEDTGGSRGRSIELDLSTGKIKLSVLGAETKEM